MQPTNWYRPMPNDTSTLSMSTIVCVCVQIWSNLVFEFPEDGVEHNNLCSCWNFRRRRSKCWCALVTETNCTGAARCTDNNNNILTSGDGGPATSAQRETGLLQVWPEVHTSSYYTVIYIIFTTLGLYIIHTSYMIYLHIFYVSHVWDYFFKCILNISHYTIYK